MGDQPLADHPSVAHGLFEHLARENAVQLRVFGRE